MYARIICLVLPIKTAYATGNTIIKCYYSLLVHFFAHFQYIIIERVMFSFSRVANQNTIRSDGITALVTFSNMKHYFNQHF